VPLLETHEKAHFSASTPTSGRSVAIAAAGHEGVLYDIRCTTEDVGDDRIVRRPRSEDHLGSIRACVVQVARADERTSG
jgi:hypothetical protein